VGRPAGQLTEPGRKADVVGTSNGPVHSTSAASGVAAPLRLRLAEKLYGGHLAGAWWPHTRNLQAELADLVDHFPEQVGRVGRVLFSPPDWASTPHKVRVGRGIMKTGSFPGDDSHVVVLTLATGSRLRLLVVPPQTPPDIADELFAAAVTPANRRTGAELLAHAGERSLPA
jgi:hypothetical protein